MGAEDVRDLQRLRRHGAAGSGGRLDRRVRGKPGELLERARDLADGPGGDVAVARGGVELLVPEQDLDHADEWARKSAYDPDCVKTAPECSRRDFL